MKASLIAFIETQDKSDPLVAYEALCEFIAVQKGSRRDSYGIRVSSESIYATDDGRFFVTREAFPDKDAYKAFELDRSLSGSWSYRQENADERITYEVSGDGVADDFVFISKER